MESKRSSLASYAFARSTESGFGFGMVSDSSSVVIPVVASGVASLIIAIYITFGVTLSILSTPSMEREYGSLMSFIVSTILLITLWPLALMEAMFDD